MKYTLSSIVLAAVALASPVPEAVAVAPGSFRINNVVSGGSGCPQGSIDIDWTNSQILPIYFSKEFTASVGPYVQPDQSRKNCQINIDLRFSSGYQYAVYSADYAGWGDLDAGVKGLVKATYYFSGEQSQISTSSTIQGPFSGRYTKHDEIPLSVWSPCGNQALLNVNAEVALTPLGGSASGTLAATKESSRFTHSLYIKWRQC
ncbi:hypothetical protein BU24DRAFT_432390 [Aaosphaeria arxii CBS 175.79]|uniref:DUF4360 domain-containing protein n=1 Tax=Aaosphaeria arxii CBS 175.79 TaxID=1450172 RepID=A0A6A5XYJ3_9PLEO|nr:uncharacterized protein BU24DRAFT_432390 [Aaosphaeria arxii CBS 175.79]KAF2017781.1 hypothetical protein BU24DRAFT_432390 [Aaosphaeria arxii CBS 175.79]